jgi:hypothetical protein
VSCTELKEGLEQLDQVTFTSAKSPAAPLAVTCNQMLHNNNIIIIITIFRDVTAFTWIYM